MFLKEIQKEYKRHKLIYILLFIISISSFFLLDIVNYSKNSMEKVINEHQTINKNNKRYRLVDSMDQNDTLSIFFEDMNRLEDLKHFSYELANNPVFSYSIAYDNPISVEFSAIHLFPESAFSYKDNESYEENRDKNDYAVNTIEVTKNIENFYNLSMDIGTFLQEEDYIYTNDGKINIVLGSDYKKTLFY